MDKTPLFTWIKNAYAMEKEIEVTLDRFEKDTEEYPDLQRLIREHKEQTQSQAQRLYDILDAHEESIPTLKEGAGKVMGFLSAESTELTKDQVVKIWITLHTTEHFEMANYKVILEACDLLAEPDIATICRDILHEEEDAVRKIDQVMPNVLASFISKQS